MHMPLYWSDIQQFRNIREVDVQIIIDIDLDCGVKWILDAHDITFKVIYSNGLSPWIHDPILTYSGIFVVVELADIII